MADILQRLKQRKLVQWAVAYLAAAWVLLQVLDLASGSYAWPRAVMHIAFGILAVGFVVVLVLAWYHGERDVQRVNGVELLIVALILAVGGGLLWNFARAPARATVAGAGTAMHGTRLAGVTASRTAANHTAAASAPFKPPAASIVVLPFANLSGDKSQQYFSDGITEELTGALGRNTGLTVIAWQTAAHYRDSTETPTEIGKALNVAQMLDGSIQRAGNEVRVSVELVSTVTGRQTWSAHYDDSLKNIFGVQDKITASIARAMKVKFAGMQAAPTLNPDAHKFYLKGLPLLYGTTAEEVQAAQDYFQQALKLDPNYADAWAAWADAEFGLTQSSTLSLREALPKMRVAAYKALALDPRNVHALADLGLADENDQRTAQAREELKQALKLDPNSVYAHLDYGLVVPLKQSLIQFGEAVRLDPANAIAWYNLAQTYQNLGEWARELTAAQTLSKLASHGIDVAFDMAFAYAQMGRGGDAVKAFDRVHPATAIDKQLVAAGQLTYQALLQPSLRPRALAALDKLRRDKLSPLSQQDVIPLYVALGENSAALQMLPRMCAASPILCSDLAINPVWTPLHGSPSFEKLAKRYNTIMREDAPASPMSP